jgi:hypothetical protein
MPIGIQDFEKLRRGNCLYVDKTAFVHELARLDRPYFLGRPRRFGKSLFLTTLKAYFLNEEVKYGFLNELLPSYTARQALAQIDAAGYLIPYRSDGRRLVKVGAVFDRHKGRLTGWEVD